jgi:hypothetical protein
MLTTLLLLAGLIWVYPSTGDFRVDNPFWNGLTIFTMKFEASKIDSLNNLTPGKGMVLILIPYTQLSEQELEKLKSYVTSGGTLIILDDYGFGNQVFNHLELEMKFKGKPLLDPIFNYKNKWLPKTMDFPQTSSIKSIILNHATALNNVSEAKVLAWSSRFSYLDLDGDSIWDPNEPTGPFPIAAYERVGEGHVVAVADPSIIINSMITLDDNLAFIENIVELQNEKPKIVIDQSHLPKEHLVEAKETIATAYTLVSSPLGTLSLITIILALTLYPLWRKE